MPSILVRDLDAKIANRLKALAKQHGRSLQSEIKAILTEAAFSLVNEASAVSTQWRKGLPSRDFGDSSNLMHEDRRIR